MKKLLNYFTKVELALWGASTALILVNDLYGFVNWKRMEKRQLQTV